MITRRNKGEMDLSGSQHNSASPSESGWTHYLDQSSRWENHLESSGISAYEGKVARLEDEEEDLSMVSDASSGPPHYHAEVDKFVSEIWHPYHSSTSQSKKVKERGKNQQLDDTASSPVQSLPKKKVSFSGNGAVDSALNFSQGFSAARLKVKPKFQKHFNFFKHSLDGKQSSGEPGDFGEGKGK